MFANDQTPWHLFLLACIASLLRWLLPAATINLCTSKQLVARVWFPQCISKPQASWGRTSQRPSCVSPMMEMELDRLGQHAVEPEVGGHMAVTWR
jgi:hypothetical protein